MFTLHWCKLMFTNSRSWGSRLRDFKGQCCAGLVCVKRKTNTGIFCLSNQFFNFFFADCGIENPWLVDSLFQFQFFCCPECEEKVSEIQEFIKHAISKHPKVRCFKKEFLYFPSLDLFYHDFSEKFCLRLVI